MNEPSCSLNTMDWTLGWSTTASMIAKRVSGTRAPPFRAPMRTGSPLPGWILAAAGEVAQRLHALGIGLHLELPEFESGVGLNFTAPL